MSDLLSVRSVPMRNGNFRSADDDAVAYHVRSVPMRNGNHKTMSYISRLFDVRSVPMRNGNLPVLFWQQFLLRGS
ncbi:protein of unknown function [Kyrpidia spormannii]|uniref:Uncharacterized protein n=1 Tax=Kyrpidia spormannii TaxID=2055160 RepID=A0A6F9EF78_9BACL|nr:protein of unknown function [Kyrpidia spormannii]